MTTPKRATPLNPLKPGEATKRAVTLWEDPEFEDSYPNLLMYLTQETYEGGSARRTSTLTLFTEGGGLTVILNDRENNRSMFVNEASLVSALLKIDDALRDGTADWRIKRNGQNPFDSKVPF